ncbi:hypothetical protein QWZ13_07165 [Reinekea marina]|uniref:hypothetical protein n=1 Tax=Reinekea marina TaxID=1310421 RepID=UPI0025B54245|nr:hypothetical protein [Reinekea marina]MDN3648692.1 hypothetical protein [Reinekea marina]
MDAAAEPPWMGSRRLYIYKLLCFAFNHRRKKPELKRKKPRTRRGFQCCFAN